MSLDNTIAIGAAIGATSDPIAEIKHGVQKAYEKGTRYRPRLPLSPGDEIDVNGWTFRVIKAGMGAVVMKPMRPVIEKQVSDGAKEESQ